MAADSDVVSDYEALREDVGKVLGERDVLKASGPDAQSYLDGQLSQDIAALEEGKSSWSFILQPTGKVDVYCRVFRTQAHGGRAASEAEFYIEVPRGWGEIALARLNRFKLRVDCELELLNWQIYAVRGPKSAEVAEKILSQADFQTTLFAPVAWGEAAGFDWLGADLLGAASSLAAIRECSVAALEALRIEAGIPQMGKDISEGAIPAEVGNRILEDAVSFIKGCYVGQELVACVDSRGGNVPRRLLGLMFEDSAAPEASEPLYEAPDSARRTGKQVGTLTSVASSPRLGSIGLALIHRSVEQSAKLVCGNFLARVTDLPFPNKLSDKAERR